MNVLSFGVFCCALFNLSAISKNSYCQSIQNDTLIVKRIENIDYSINNKVVYMDKNRFIIKTLGKSFNKYYHEEKIILTTMDNKQYCILQITPGNAKSDFSFFRVGYVSNLKKTFAKKRSDVFKNFVSSSGVKLGLTLNQFFKIKDSSLFEKIVYRNGEYAYYYKIYDTKDEYHEILSDKYFNLPYYTCIYHFNKKNRLIEFGFGLTPSCEGITD